MALTAGRVALTSSAEATIVTTGVSASVRLRNDSAYAVLVGPTGNPVHQLGPGEKWEFKGNAAGGDNIFGIVAGGSTMTPARTATVSFIMSTG